ncbi:hypothetical protein D3C81_2039370 [compost metagenome]
MGHHQLVTGRVVGTQHRLQQQLPVVANVVAMDGQCIAGTAAAVGHVDDSGVAQCRPLAGGVGADSALGHG